MSDDIAVAEDTVSENIEGYNEHVAELMDEYSDVFVDKPGYCDWLKHRIDTVDAKPIRHPPYRMSPVERASLSQQVDDMLRQGVIERSNSAWARPVVMVPKKNGTSRLAVEYRSVNAVTKSSNYPIPSIDSILHSLYGSCVFSTLDVKSGFW